MGSHDPFGYLKLKLWPKGGLGVKESNWQFDSQPLKVGNHPDSLGWRWIVTYFWKFLDKGYNFASDLISIGGLHTKLCTPKVVGVPIIGISELPLWSLGTKCHLDANLVAMHRIYYKGEGGGFPQVWVVVNFENLNSPMACLSTKSAPTMH
jgi:hypothetical protein